MGENREEREIPAVVRLGGLRLGVAVSDDWRLEAEPRSLFMVQRFAPDILE